MHKISIHLCPICRSADVEIAEWRHLNTTAPENRPGEDIFWCNDCQDEIPGTVAADPGAQIRAEMDRALEQLRERVGAEKVAALEDALGEGERRSSPEYYRVQEGER
jgi:hypothetical protein